MLKGALRKIFRRKIEIELINKSRFDLDIDVKFKNKNSIELIVKEKEE